MDTPLDWHARALRQRYLTEACIDGRFAPALSGQTYASHDPATGRLLGQVAACGEADVEQAVRAARRSFDSGVWSRCAPAQRKQVLLRLSQLMLEHVEELALLESLDVGKPVQDALAVDIPGAANVFRWYAESVDKLYGQVAPQPPGVLATITREALGVVAAVVPWNFPLDLAAWKLAPALAAGNSVILKPAEQSPGTALRLAELALEAGLPPGVINFVPGNAADISGLLLASPQLGGIHFTGSTAVFDMMWKTVGGNRGRYRSYPRLVGETGGKDFILAHPSADPQALAVAIARGGFEYQGQKCSAASRAYVPRSLWPDVRDRLVGMMRGMRMGDPTDFRTFLGAVIDKLLNWRFAEANLG